jgi:zinc transport system ATP-binding protein
MSGALAIDVHDLRIERGGVTILEGVNLTLERGRFLGIIGPNGGGKSTLLRALTGLERPTSGRVRVLGAAAGTSREVSFVPQAPTFDFRFPADVKDVVSMGLTREQRRQGDASKERVREMIAGLGLSDLARKPAGVLSGGERQRMFLARALVRDPRLLLLDEPTLGVDARALDEFLHLLIRIRGGNDLTIVMVTHDFSVVSTHAEEVVCLARGIHFCGSPSELDEGRLASVYGVHNLFLEHRH